MRKLVREQRPAGIARWRVALFAEHHMVSHRVRERIDCGRRRSRERIRVHPHVREVLTEPALHVGAHSGRERATRRA
jgi:hypothetical protein